MSFNKNATKRLSLVAGISRESTEITDIVNELVKEYLCGILRQAAIICSFTGKRTILVNDIQFLSQVCGNIPKIICPNNLSKITQVSIKNIISNGYAVYTCKKPFFGLVRGLLDEMGNRHLRLGKNVVPLLQYLTEQEIISIMIKAKILMELDGRDTLLLRDMSAIIKLRKS